jgi:V/A-type H+-transporting ATPase subunit I
MAVLQMQRISITGLKKDRKQILEFIQRRGAIEITDRIPEDSVFHKMDVSTAESIFEKNISVAKESLQIMASNSTEKKPFLDMLNGRNEVSIEVYDAFSTKHDSIAHTAKRICTLAKEIAEKKAEILKLQTQLEILSPWISLDIPMNFAGTKYTASFIGTLPNAWMLEDIYEKLADQTPFNVDIIVLPRSKPVYFYCVPEIKQILYLRRLELLVSHDLIPFMKKLLRNN